MEKTQRDVLTMMKVLGIPLLNEDGPGYKNLNFELLRALVKEEAQEFNDSITGLMICTRRLPGWRKTALSYAYPGDYPRLRAMDDDEFTRYWWAETIDAIVDTIVVLHNTTNAMGIDLEPFWDEVQRANLAKADGPVREDGKKLKPPDWKPPRIKEILEGMLK